MELKDKTGFEDVRSLTCARSAARRLKMAEDEIEDLKSQLHVREHDLRVAEIKRDESRANCNFSENLLKIKENTIDSSNAIIK